MTWILIAVVALGVAGTLVARAGAPDWLAWIAKPLASTAFVALALSRGALDSGFGRAVLVALVFSWFGDVLLISTRPPVFRIGVLAFLLGHLAFVAAFVVLGAPPWLIAAAAVAMALPATVILRWLWPHVDAPMRRPAVAYMVVISLMVASAIAVAASTGRWWLLAAAVAFYCSDIAVARERFVQPSLINRLWGLPLYYAAQVLFALQIAG